MAVDYYSDHNGAKPEEEEDDDYIDMEVSSFTHFFSLSKTAALSPPHNPREFEFQMSSSNVEKDTTTSPADELFYKGKLLPLHLPPRLQMVEKLLEDSTPNKFNEFYSTPLGTNSAATPVTGTPFESCNISPAESCQVSCELNPEEYFRDFATNEDEQNRLINDHNPRKSWAKKLKTKIKSLFGKSGCSDESSALHAATKTKEKRLSFKANGHTENQMKVSRKIPFGQIPRMVSRDRLTDKEHEVNDNANVCHRRSFSGAFKRRSSITKLSSSSSSGSCSSSSSSSSSSGSNSNGSQNDQQPLKRSSSAKSEMEGSLIQGAIAHCKQSQQVLRSRKTLSEVGFHSLSSSRFGALDDQTRPTGVCRG